MASVRASLSSLMIQPDTSSATVPVLTSSTQSVASPFDSTSLRRTDVADGTVGVVGGVTGTVGSVGGVTGTGAVLTAPLVDALIATKSPVPFGNLPYVTAAWAVQLYESTRVALSGR
jgi:hypothetical protein